MSAFLFGTSPDSFFIWAVLITAALLLMPSRFYRPLTQRDGKRGLNLPPPDPPCIALSHEPRERQRQIDLLIGAKGGNV